MDQFKDQYQINMILIYAGEGAKQKGHLAGCPNTSEMPLVTASNGCSQPTRPAPKWAAPYPETIKESQSL
jgi:hypothetical protein